MIKKIFLILALVGVLPWQAQAQFVQRGLELSPFLLELDVPKGEQIASQIDLINRGDEPLQISVTPRDFLPGEEGQPQFVPDTEINDPTFSLASWIQLSSPERFSINPGQIVTINFTVNPPENAEQGTHYGALLFSYAGEGSAGSVSEVQQSVGTILLVYYGQARENGLVDLATNQRLFFQADKVTFTNVFQNIGNVHVKPKGEVYIKNIFGKVVATPHVNRDASNVLPKTNRAYVSTWYPSSWAFGRYTAESVVSYGRTRLEARDKVVVWVLPWYLLSALGLIAAFILWAIFHGRHIHRRWIIRKHTERNQ